MASTVSSSNDTYTELNKGVNGSKMDETAVTQVDPETFAETQVHRERVVLGLDTGELVGRPDSNGTDLPTYDRRVTSLLTSIDQTLKDLLRFMMNKR